MESVQSAAKFVSELARMEGVKGILAIPPVFFKPLSIDDLVDAMAIVAGGAPHLPFWYYHIPAYTGVYFNMYQYLKAVDASGKIPNFMGVKFTYETLSDFNAMGHYKNGKYNMIGGRDEMYTSFLATGVCDADISTSVNYLTFNLDAAKAWNEGDFKKA